MLITIPLVFQVFFFFFGILGSSMLQVATSKCVVLLHVGKNLARSNVICLTHVQILFAKRASQPAKWLTVTPTSHHFRRPNSVSWLGDAYLRQNENHLYVSFVDMFWSLLTLPCLLLSLCLRYMDPTLSLLFPTSSCSIQLFS
jgi:hypothetical protein